MRRFLRLPLFSLLFVLPASATCGDDSPTGITAGTEMTVAEQVAIEAALATVAESLDEQGGADTLLADLTRIAARLVRLQGRQGEITVQGFPGTSGAQSMHAAAVQVVDATANPILRVQVVVVWQGLDVDQFTVDRAIVVVAPTEGEETGSFTIPSGQVPGGARLVDFTVDPSAHLSSATGGALSVVEAAFGGNCPGIQNTSSETCTTGRQAVGATVVLEAGEATWPAAELPAFRLSSMWPPD